MAQADKKINAPKWQIKWERITKEQAQTILAKTVTFDRTTKDSWVKALAETMDLGLWVEFSPAQAPIAFDKDGNRINGKHRLQALVLSKLPSLVFPVVRGLEPEDWAMFDQNQRSRLKSAAHPGRDNVSRDRARITWLRAMQTADLSTVMTEPLFDHLAQKTWRKEIEWADEVINRCGGQGRAHYAAAFMYAHRAAPEFTDKTARAWVNGGSGLPSQLLKVRDVALGTAKGTGGNRNRNMGQTFKVLTALALMHQGKPLPSKLTPSTAGLRYFSALIRDGAAGRWDKSVPVEEE